MHCSMMFRRGYSAIQKNPQNIDLNHAEMPTYHEGEKDSILDNITIMESEEICYLDVNKSPGHNGQNDKTCW